MKWEDQPKEDEGDRDHGIWLQNAHFDSCVTSEHVRGLALCASAGVAQRLPISHRGLTFSHMQILIAAQCSDVLKHVVECGSCTDCRLSLNRAVKSHQIQQGHCGFQNV